METATRARPNRLSDERIGEIFETVLDLVAQRGFDAVTMDAISEATHCSKATIYRQWGDKTRLVVEALARPDERGEIPDTGSLRGDLRAALTQGYPYFAGRSLLVVALLHAAARHPDLAGALHERMENKDPDLFGVVIGRAVERGEIAADAPGIQYAGMLLLARLAFDVVPGVPANDLDSFLDYVDDVLLPVLGLPHHPAQPDQPPQ